jgi:hypothetical protein
MPTTSAHENHGRESSIMGGEGYEASTIDTSMSGQHIEGALPEGERMRAGY